MEQKPIQNKQKEKLKGKIKTLNIIAICLLIVQVLGYLTTSKNTDNDAPSQSFAYYIGLNLWLIIAIVLFTRASLLSSKMNENKKNENPNF